eukprot:3940240-Rhodomonas_salina.2
MIPSNASAKALSILRKRNSTALALPTPGISIRYLSAKHRTKCAYTDRGAHLSQAHSLPDLRK